VQQYLRNDSLSEIQGKLCDISPSHVGTILRQLYVQ
jgi:hypothetical protein